MSNWNLEDIKTIVNLIMGLPEVSTVDYKGEKIQTVSKGRIHRLQWVWDAKVTNLSTGVAGESRHHKSRSGAIEHAVADIQAKSH
jgi:hypothetical protein